MRLTLDATPLLGARTGIGRYVEQLLAELPAAFARASVDAEVRAATFTARGAALTALPPGVVQAGHRVPARLVRSVWQRSTWLPVEAVVGRTDVFHGTNFVTGPTRRAREVVTVHDLTYLDLPDTVRNDALAYRELVHRSLDRGALVLTPSHAVADAVRDRYGLPAGRVRATPLGVDAAWSGAAPAREGWLADHGLPLDYLVFVGSLDPRKNLVRLVQAHELARAEDASVPDLVLAGPAGRAALPEGRPGVHLTGWLGDDELRSLVAGARALALPSLDEGFGLPALEALAAGRPVILSDVPALREVAGPHGFFAPATDTGRLAQALLDGVGAEDSDAARAARRTWAARWTWTRTADLTVDAYLAGAA